MCINNDTMELSKPDISILLEPIYALTKMSNTVTVYQDQEKTASRESSRKVIVEKGTLYSMLIERSSTNN